MARSRDTFQVMGDPIGANQSKVNRILFATHYPGAHIGGMYQFGAELLFLVHIELQLDKHLLP